MFRSPCGSERVQIHRRVLGSSFGRRNLALDQRGAIGYRIVSEMFPHGWFHLSKWRPWLIAAAVVYAIFTFPLFPGSDLITELGWSAVVVIVTAARRKILAWVRSEETRK